MLRALTTSSDIWSHGASRRLIPPELFALLGFGTPNLGTLSPNQARDLVGESMSVAVVGMVLMSLLVHLPIFEETS